MGGWNPLTNYADVFLSMAKTCDGAFLKKIVNNNCYLFSQQKKFFFSFLWMSRFFSFTMPFEIFSYILVFNEFSLNLLLLLSTLFYCYIIYIQRKQKHICAERAFSCYATGYFIAACFSFLAFLIVWAEKNALESIK